MVPTTKFVLRRAAKTAFEVDAKVAAFVLAAHQLLEAPLVLVHHEDLLVAVKGRVTALQSVILLQVSRAALLAGLLMRRVLHASRQKHLVLAPLLRLLLLHVSLVQVDWTELSRFERDTPQAHGLVGRGRLSVLAVFPKPDPRHGDRFILVNCLRGFLLLSA